MVWFMKKKQPKELPTVSVRDAEIKTHKNAIKEAADDANNASNKLNNLIGNNGFTIIIAASMGAKRQGGVNIHGH